MPVVADVREDDYCLDPDAAAAAIWPRTRFVLPVHLYGQMADMRTSDARCRPARCSGSSRTLARRTARARRDAAPGAVGIAAAFSFYPAKNLGAIGDAGALVTDDEELAATVRALREHGQTRKYHHALEGYTARLDTIQALVLLHKLPHLDGWNAERRASPPHYTSRARRRRRPASCRSSRRAASPSGTSTSSRTADPAGARDLPRGARHRHRPALPGAAAPLGGVRAARLPARARSRLRRRSPARRSRCRSSPASPRRSSTRSSQRVSDVLRAVADGARQTRRRTG